MDGGIWAWWWGNNRKSGGEPPHSKLAEEQEKDAGKKEGRPLRASPGES
jgi:hypothetical protein